MNECWCALALAIMSPNYITREMAFLNLDRGKIIKTNTTLTADNFEDMWKLKNDLRYQDIADIYGIEMTCLFKRMKDFKKGLNHENN